MSNPAEAEQYSLIIHWSRIGLESLKGGSVSLRTLKVIFGAVMVCFLVASAYIAVASTAAKPP
jgi:hypothetical protein